MANIGAGLTGGMGVRQPEPNRHGSHQRARTQVSSLITALAVVLFLLTMTGLLNGVPRCSCRASWSSASSSSWISPRCGTTGVCGATTSPPHSRVSAGADPRPLYGLLLAVGLSLLGLTFRASRVHIDPLWQDPREKVGWAALQGHPERMPTPGVLVLRLDAPLFWANCATSHARILELIDDHPDTKALVLDLEATGQMDATTVAELTQILEQLRAAGIELFIARLHYPRVVLQRAGFTDDLGRGHIWHSISQTVRAARRHIRGASAGRPDAAELDGLADPG